ncbi:uncharacterized protein ARMOST_09055 [Armillaria ostoyae]|uniref:Uncharacterized protein n=1 Tax=Armillaria ostoyae TaxID=47428 RepID=A0A284RAE7_ARMOS|nr:uncharacterized protein ARMOST_09055 [Armillaria ostoyae]
MASLAFTRNPVLTRNALFTLFRIPAIKPLFAANFLPAFLTAPNPFTWRIPSLLELFPSIVLAVPKKKTSHSRKAMRAANKGLKDKQNIVNCPGSERGKTNCEAACLICHETERFVQRSEGVS